TELLLVLLVVAAAEHLLAELVGVAHAPDALGDLATPLRCLAHAVLGRLEHLTPVLAAGDRAEIDRSDVLHCPPELQCACPPAGKQGRVLAYSSRPHRVDALLTRDGVTRG